jgi:hypothetical protein
MRVNKRIAAAMMYVDDTSVGLSYRPESSRNRTRSSNNWAVSQSKRSSAKKSRVAAQLNILNGQKNPFVRKRQNFFAVGFPPINSETNDINRLKFRTIKSCSLTVTDRWLSGPQGG